jgi:hypothetical protein
MKKKVPLYCFYWNEISMEQFLDLIEFIKNSRYNEYIIFPYSKKDQEKYVLAKS